MSTRFKLNNVPTLGEERFYKYDNVNEDDIDFVLPSCGIEDVDRAVFHLFDRDLNFINKEGGQTKKVPVIFATGERAFLLRKKIPLHDVNETLILPIISIVRSSIEQGSDSGVGPGNGEMVISKKISKRNLNYKVLSEDFLKNNVEKASAGYRNTSAEISVGNTEKNNIYEVITMPSPRYFKITYEITFWTHYQTQMNNMLEILMQSYNINPARSFRIETDKGYWFVATVDQSFSQQGNNDSYSEDERMVRQSFNVSVNGYLINPSGDGHLPVLKKYTSSPMLQFTLPITNFESGDLKNNVASGNVEDYILEDFHNIDDPLPARLIAKKGEVNNGVNKETNIVKNNKIISKVTDPFRSKNVRANIQKGLKGELIIKVLE